MSDLNQRLDALEQDVAERKRLGRRNAVLSVLGLVFVAAVAWAGPMAARDAGSRLIGLHLGVGGISTLVALDAGVQSKVGGVSIGGLIAQDAGVSTHTCQFGYGAGTGGVLAVTYTRAFTSNPQCQCTHVGTTNTNPCVLTTAAVPTVTAASFTVASGDTDVIHWMCCGDI